MKILMNTPTSASSQCLEFILLLAFKASSSPPLPQFPLIVLLQLFFKISLNFNIVWKKKKKKHQEIDTHVDRKWTRLRSKLPNFWERSYSRSLWELEVGAKNCQLPILKKFLKKENENCAGLFWRFCFYFREFIYLFIYLLAYAV